MLVLSGFFSMSETSMMAVNRYRLRTLAKAGNRGAKLAEWLLSNTDKLLGVILLGNNLINAAAASLVTIIAFRLFGQNEMALTLSTLTVTFLILVFSEVTPKVIGASYPDRIAPAASYILAPLLRLTYPAIWFVNLFVQRLLKLMRLDPQAASGNSMGVEELRTLLAESGNFLPAQHRGILLNLFDLEHITVDDVMVPRGQIEALDLGTEMNELVHQIATSHHARLPVYEGESNNLVGVLHVRRVLARIHEDDFDMEVLREALRAPYFIPSDTNLYTQLEQFQATRQSVGLVVDEYGELLGLVTLEDILEEIVGEFASLRPGAQNTSLPQEDGSYLVEGAMSVRELNRKLKLDLPVDGARTLNGLILDKLEAMPEPGVSVMIAGYPMEIMQVLGRMVKTARIGQRRPSGNSST
ncbi:MAG: HlyC/CorC family transporter [Pseudomonadota bacterium]|nr:HlyC/CorC family transporter [Pseudomonadota bacterium]MDP1903018.1 HlyC/CorC family transporter [Pseudomonadota bacterium]MDP2352210.1 HlyC/CorC family transporter [Pseudomonadota bacterium]